MRFGSPDFSWIDGNGTQKTHRPGRTFLGGLPAAAQGPIDGNEIQSDVASRRGQLVLLGQKLSLDREDPIEVNESLLVLLQHQFYGAVRGVGALGEAAGLQLRLQETNQAV